MSDGLVTRIGKWIDSKFEDKVTFVQLQDYEKECQDRHIGALQAVAEVKESLEATQRVADNLQRVINAQPTYVDHSKDLEELKTRMERMELYAGMARKVDPSKPPVVKSAFSM